jgi:Chlorophyll A-B binding protein
MISCSSFPSPFVFARLRVLTRRNEKSKAVPFLLAPKNLKGLVGSKDFDPIGFSDWVPVAFLQEAEIKHSRIAMLAFLGWVATEFVKLPGVHEVSPIAAHDAAVASGAGVQVLTAIAALEFIGVVALKETVSESEL